MRASRLGLTFPDNQNGAGILNPVDSVILRFENVTKSHKIEERLKYEAGHDLLTGAYHRRAVLARLDRSVDLSKRYNRSLHFCMIDSDFFKNEQNTTRRPIFLLRRYREEYSIHFMGLNKMIV